MSKPEPDEDEDTPRCLSCGCIVDEGMGYCESCDLDREGDGPPCEECGLVECECADQDEGLAHERLTREGRP